MHAKTRSDNNTSAAWLPLLIGVGLTLGVTLYPFILAKRTGAADHVAALLALWAMSAGYVRGVGFIPRQWAWRWLFSTSACLSALAAATLRMWLQHGP